LKGVGAPPARFRCSAGAANWPATPASVRAPVRQPAASRTATPRRTGHGLGRMLRVYIRGRTLRCGASLMSRLLKGGLSNLTQGPRQGQTPSRHPPLPPAHRACAAAQRGGRRLLLEMRFQRVELASRKRFVRQTPSRPPARRARATAGRRLSGPAQRPPAQGIRHIYSVMMITDLRAVMMITDLHTLRHDDH
jgi:hypothetical protein